MSLFPDAPHHIGRLNTTMLDGPTFTSPTSDTAHDQRVNPHSVEQQALHMVNNNAAAVVLNNINNNDNNNDSNDSRNAGSNDHPSNDSDNNAMLWTTDDPRANGLYSYSAVGDMNYTHVMNAAAPFNTPVSWAPNSFTAATASLAPSACFSFREDSLCNITDDGTETSWQQFSGSQPIVIGEEGCPSPSSHSCSSRPSAISSPYSHSDVGLYAQLRDHSPMVKLEEHSDFSHLVNPGTWDIRAMGAPGLARPDELMIGADCHSLYSHATSSSFEVQRADERKPIKQDDSDVPQRSFTFERMTTDMYMIPRRKRILTKPENASCSCDICGKPFQRAYNLKAHMITHDPLREQPHVCGHNPCQRAFVRRTDLLRHELSVHIKSRPYRCNLCSAGFSRKDTLRRHVDDGCARRPEFRRRMLKSRRHSDGP